VNNAYIEAHSENRLILENVYRELERDVHNSPGVQVECRITDGSSMQAIRRTGSRHFWQVSMSMLNTRFRRFAQVIAAWCSAKVLSSGLPLFAVRCKYPMEAGEVHSGLRYQGGHSGDESSGSNMAWVVPLRNEAFSS